MADDLSKLIAGINKDLKGAAKIQNITEVETPYETRLPFGIMSLDMHLHGGLPAGTLNQIFGPDGSGKDYMTNLLMAEVQKKYGDKTNLFWMSFGYKPDLPFMRFAGVKIPFTDEELLAQGIDPRTATAAQRGEQIGNLLFIDLGDGDDGSDKPAESLMSAALRLISSNKFQLGIINELGSGETKDNVKKDLHEDAKVATWASLMSDFLRKYYTAMRTMDDAGHPNATTIVMINPVRANMDAYSAKFTPFTQGGGFALKHAKAIDIHIKSGQVLKKGDEKIGKETKWKISKGKHGIHEGAEGEFNFYFEYGVDNLADLVASAKAMGVIRNHKPNLWIKFGDVEEKMEADLDSLAVMLRTDSELADRIRVATITAANKKRS